MIACLVHLIFSGSPYPTPATFPAKNTAEPRLIIYLSESGGNGNNNMPENSAYQTIPQWNSIEKPSVGRLLNMISFYVVLSCKG
jgi:hypothetical protein